MQEKAVNSVEWINLTFGEFTKNGAERMYFIFTNDYYNANSGADLNLKIRKIPAM